MANIDIKLRDAQNGCQELIHKVQEGDKRAFEDIVCLFKPCLNYYSYKYSQTACGLERDDLYQSGLIALWDILLRMNETYEDTWKKPGPFIRVCIRNAMIDYLRDMGAKKHQILTYAKKIKEGEEEEEKETHVITSYATTEKMVIARETIKEILGCLNDMQYTIVVHCWIGFSYAELIRKFDRNTVTAAIRTARRKVTKILQGKKFNFVNYKMSSSADNYKFLSNKYSEEMVIDKNMIENMADKLSKLQYMVAMLRLDGQTNVEIAEKLNTKSDAISNILNIVKMKIINKDKKKSNTKGRKCKKYDEKMIQKIKLSSLESDVITLRLAGLSNREIATELKLSIKKINKAISRVNMKIRGK